MAEDGDSTTTIAKKRYFSSLGYKTDVLKLTLLLELEFWVGVGDKFKQLTYLKLSCTLYFSLFTAFYVERKVQTKWLRGKVIENSK